MNHKTHRNLAKLLYPDIPFKTIDKVNSSIDSPNKQMKALQNSGMFDSKTLDAFGLKSHGHRKYNHGIDSAFISAYMVSPEHAMDLAMTHLVLDKMGNYLNDTIGNDEKDIFEGTLNKFCSMYRQNVLGIKPRKKRMFF